MSCAPPEHPATTFTEAGRVESRSCGRLTSALRSSCSFTMTLVRRSVDGTEISERTVSRRFELTWKIAQWPIVFILVATALAISTTSRLSRPGWVWTRRVAARDYLVGAHLPRSSTHLDFGNYTETRPSRLWCHVWFYLSGIATSWARVERGDSTLSPYGRTWREGAREKKKSAPSPTTLRGAQGEGEIPWTRPEGVTATSRRAARAPTDRPSKRHPIGTAALLPRRSGRHGRQKQSRGYAARQGEPPTSATPTPNSKLPGHRYRFSELSVGSWELTLPYFFEALSHAASFWTRRRLHASDKLSANPKEGAACRVRRWIGRLDMT